MSGQSIRKLWPVALLVLFALALRLVFRVGLVASDDLNYLSAARALLDDDYNKNPAIFPSAETLAKCESEIYLGEEVQRVKDEAWTRVLAA